MDKDLRQDFSMQGMIQIEKQVVLNSKKTALFVEDEGDLML